MHQGQGNIGHAMARRGQRPHPLQRDAGPRKQHQKQKCQPMRLRPNGCKGRARLHTSTNDSTGATTCRRKNHTHEHRAPTRGHRGLRCPHTQHWCAQKRKAKKHPGDGSSVPESTKHTPRLMSLESCRQTATTIPMIQTTHHLRHRHVQEKTNSCSRPQAQCAKARAQKHTHTHTHARSGRCA